MVVEYALAASIPGFLITIHHMVQFSRPRIGYGSDVGGKRTPWIIGGMFILATGSLTAAFGATLIPSLGWLGAIVAALGYFLIGIGSAAAGTSLLILLSKLVSDQRKPAAASLVWFMMIMGFALTGGITGQLLDPFSEGRLLTVVAGVAVIALLVSCTAIIGIERSAQWTSRPPRHPTRVSHRLWRHSRASGRRATRGVLLFLSSHRCSRIAHKI